MTEEQTLAPEAAAADYDGYAPAPFEDHLAVIDAARRGCPVVHSEHQGGYWLVSRYADVREVLSTPETFSSRNGMALPRNPLRPPTPPIDQDGGRHRDFRRIINPYLTPAAVEAQSDTVREVARGLIAPLLDRGEADVVRDYAHPFTAMVVARTVFGLDTTYEHEMVLLRDLVADMGHDKAEGESVARAWLAAHEFGAKILRDRAPDDPRDDLVASLLRGQVDGQPLSSQDQAGVMAIVMLGGLKTSASVLSTIIETGIGQPEQRERLSNPDWVRRSIDEFLRMGPPIAWGGREVTQPVDIGGVRIEAGEHVMCHFGSANRDADQFEDPDTFDPDRPGANRHLGFGFGVHRCVGAHLARLEITIAVSEFMSAVTDLEWKAGSSGSYSFGQEWGPDSFPVTFSPAGA